MRINSLENQNTTMQHKAVIDNLPARFEDKGFSNYKITENNKETYEKCLAFYRGEAKKDGLVLLGKVGSGKTHLAVSVMKNLKPIKFQSQISKIGSAIQYRDGIRSAKSVFLTADEFFMELTDAQFVKKSKLDVMTNYLNSYDMVCLDDLGIKNFTPAKQENLYTFINRAYLDKKRIIITSNFLLEELAEKDERIPSRLNEMALILRFNDEDWRLKFNK